MTTETLVAILAALGGGGFIIQAIRAFRDWRDGVKQREEAADERLVTRLEKRIDTLEIERRQDAEYVRRLIMALGRAGIEIPERSDGKAV